MMDFYKQKWIVETVFFVLTSSQPQLFLVTLEVKRLVWLWAQRREMKIQKQIEKKEILR